MERLPSTKKIKNIVNNVFIATYDSASWRVFILILIYFCFYIQVNEY